MIRWDPLSEFERLFAGASGAVHQFPAVNVWTNADGAIVTAELPGMKPEDVDISVIGETLTLRGNRKPFEAPQDARFHRQERLHGEFSRTLQLPFRIDAGKVDAQVCCGLLKISLPRAEADKPRKVAIQAA